ncbi:MAG: acyl carrier protein [Sinobacteraceae bacterium]|nr:acyl carrier protein [Nevskiaceae bacterium]MCP5360384.1 acyl carrier protein [Nevskiaceae bacterium]MCP5467143.1 acyl carrier protein [Nevskiaceae bacterium]
MIDDQVLQFVIQVASREADDLGYDELRAPTAETVLYGDDNGIDSLSLVRLVAALERAAEQQFGRRVVLADERAMSMRRSPFRTVATLAELLQERLGGPHA